MPNHPCPGASGNPLPEASLAGRRSKAKNRRNMQRSSHGRDSWQGAERAAEAVRAAWNEHPACGIVLGTGQGQLATCLDIQWETPLASLPSMPSTTAPGHSGRLVAGRWCGVPVVVMAGRCHLYEGRTPVEVTQGVRVLRALGCRCLILCNAAGGLNPRFRPGDLMVIADHVNFTFRVLRDGNALDASKADGLRAGKASVYDPLLQHTAWQAAWRAGVPVWRGTYAGVTGPCYETRAEYRMLRRIADAVGMSTVLEAELARRCGMRVAGLSIITNTAFPDSVAPVSQSQVVDVACHRAEAMVPVLEALVMASR